MNSAFSRRYNLIAITLSWFLALVWAIPPSTDPSTAAINSVTQACSVNWRDRGRYAYPTAFLVIGLLAPLTVEAAVYYGVYVGVIRASRRMHQRAIISGRGSIVNLAMRVSQSSSRWSVVSCQSRSSTSTTSSDPSLDHCPLDHTPRPVLCLQSTTLSSPQQCLRRASNDQTFFFLTSHDLVHIVHMASSVRNSV